MKRYFNSRKNIIAPNAFWRNYYALKKSQGEFVFSATLKNGFRVETSRHLISAFDEIFCREVYCKALSGLTKTPTVVDIGANVGYFSLYLLFKVPEARVLAFEPLPVNAKLLNQHKKANDLSDELTIEQSAVYGTEDRIQIHFNNTLDFSVGASILNREDTNEVMDIKAYSLPEIFSSFGFDHVDLMKIDCEGAEYNILYNCPAETFAKIDRLAIETHAWVEEGRVEELMSFLEKQGYSVRLKRNGIAICIRK